MSDDSISAKQLALQNLNAEVANCRVLYPRVQRGLNLIEEAQQNGQERSGRTGVMIYGESRSGKTKLLSIYRQNFREGADKMDKRIIFVSLTGAATVESVVADLLHALGDPMSSQGSIPNKTQRLESALDRCGTQLVMIDEAQHVIENRSDAVVNSIASWFKSLMNDKLEDRPKKIAFVLSGTAALQRLVHVDRQIRNRFFVPLEMQLFTGSTEMDIRDLRAMLQGIEKQITIAADFNLSSTENALRFQAASKGCIGIIMDLIHHGGKKAIRADRIRLELQDLAEAYDELICDNDLRNPFRLGPSDLIKTAAQRASRAPGMNGRIKAKQKETKVGDVLNLS